LLRVHTFFSSWIDPECGFLLDRKLSGLRTATRSFLSNGKETVLEVLRPFEEQNFDIAVLDDDDAQLQWIAMRASHCATALDTDSA
jgi:hypothetical protein